jgi:hypothetical protein
MSATLSSLQKFKPGTRKNWLHLTAGLVWLGVGLMLISIASRWLRLVDLSTELLLVLAGLLLAAAIGFLGFSKLARKNIDRIQALGSEKVCLFAFQSWTSYPLVAFMVSLGIYLRVYSPFPKPMLAILYLGIGGGLFYASLSYFMHILRGHRTNNTAVQNP